MPRRLPHVRLVLLASFLAASFTGCSERGAAPVPAPTAAGPAARPARGDPYTVGPASPDGIGRFYHGREIAQVMGHEGAPWLDRPERSSEERTDLLIDLLDLAPDAAVADIGAGSGTLTFPIAARVPRGRVYAVDIQPEMLALIEARAAREELGNVVTVLGAIDDTNLPPGAIDLILLVDSYHEFSHPDEMLRSMLAALKPGGRLVQVEYRGEDPAVPIKPLHKMTEAQARLEVEAAGFRWRATLGDLPRQHVLVFEKPRPGSG